MTDEEFMDMMDAMREYLHAPKTFIINPERQREINYACKIAHELFPDAAIEIVDDPIQMGALIMHVTSPDMVVSTEEEYKLLSEMLALTDNFEIYPVKREQLRFSAVFNDAFIRLKN